MHRDDAEAAEGQHPDGSPHGLAGVQPHDIHVLHGRVGPRRICCVVCACTGAASPLWGATECSQTQALCQHSCNMQRTH